MSIKFEILKQEPVDGCHLWAVKITRDAGGQDDGSYYAEFTYMDGASDACILREAKGAFDIVVSKAAKHWGIEL